MKLKNKLEQQEELFQQKDLYKNLLQKYLRKKILLVYVLKIAKARSARRKHAAQKSVDVVFADRIHQTGNKNFAVIAPHKNLAVFYNEYLFFHGFILFSQLCAA